MVFLASAGQITAEGSAYSNAKDVCKGNTETTAIQFHSDSSELIKIEKLIQEQIAT